MRHSVTLQAFSMSQDQLLRGNHFLLLQQLLLILAAVFPNSRLTRYCGGCCDVLCRSPFLNKGFVSQMLHMPLADSPRSAAFSRNCLNQITTPSLVSLHPLINLQGGARRIDGYKGLILSTLSSLPQDCSKGSCHLQTALNGHPVYGAGSAEMFD